MSKRIVLALLLIVAVGGYILLSKMAKVAVAPSDTNSKMKLTSESFDNQSQIPEKYTCDGLNINPQLSILGIPAETKSLTLIVHDPDAPGGDWTHWDVWNIDPTVREIKEGSTPSGAIVGINDFGEDKYDGPCPPSGTHHYYFDLYALDQSLDLTKGTKRNLLEASFEGHVLDKTTLVGLYTKK